MRRLAIVAVTLAGLLLPVAKAKAACTDPPDVLILLDRSATMSEGTKWTDAKTAINNVLAAYAGTIRFGLVLFPSNAGLCKVNSIQVGCADNTQAAIMAALNATAPSGSTTPIALALALADAYLKGIDPGRAKYVLIVTDGGDTCYAPGVAAAQCQQLFSDGIKTYVVGFGTGVDATVLNDMATAGGTALGGTTKYYEATNYTQLNSALNAIAGVLTCCGNGALDPGEKCDTGIPSGAGKCPTSCSDGNACTLDAVSGAACNASCTFTPITAPKSGDGCCPPGANSLNDSDCPIVCGNSLVELGESCDTAISSGAGKCPTAADCNDGNVCTSDALAGSGCTTKCAHTALAPSLAAKDGCCPVGATAATDADCSPGCGNGVLEPGETCDPGIASGPGACPTAASCNDSNPCTTDLLGGSACALACTHGAVTANPTVADGCCPSGATVATDKDCKAVCGNGLLEPGELCDPGIASGLGACDTAASCDDKDSCTMDALSGSGCDVQCTHASVAPSGGTKDGCCPPGQSSTTDADCLPPCDPDTTTNCVDLCLGMTCPPGQFCQMGKCTSFPDGGPGGPDAGVSLPQRDGGWSVAPPSGCNCRAADGPSAAALPLSLLLCAAGALLLVRLARRSR